MITISNSILEYVYYDESSPTCLRWNKDIVVGKNLIRYRKGDIAGGLNKKLNYYFVQIQGVKYRCHRIVWKLHNGDIHGYIDHIDRNRLNNKIHNLRVVSKSVNNRNASLRRDSKTGISGITKRVIKNINYYIVQVWSGNKRLTKAFNIDKLGLSAAFELALNERNRLFQLLNNSGAGYTENHGLT